MDSAESLDTGTQRAFATVNLILVGLGTAVMLGWSLELPTVVRVNPSFVPMQFNTAVGVALAGVGLLAGISRQRWLGLVTATLVFLLGLTSLMQDVTGVRLGIDTLFLHPFITQMSTFPGRPSPNSSLAFISLGVGIFLFAWGLRQRWICWAIGLLGSATATIGAVSLLGYLTGVEAAFRLVNHAGMALPAAVAFVVAGGSLSGFVAQTARLGMPDRQIDWAPWAAALSVLVAAAFLWCGLRANEAAYSQRRLTAEAYFLRQGIAAPIREDLEALQRLAWRLERAGVPPGAEWWADARRYLETEPYYVLLWADKDFGIRSAISLVRPDQRYALHLPTINDTSNGPLVELGSRKIFRSAVIELPEGGAGFYAFMPIRQGRSVAGYLVALVDLNAMLFPLLDEYLQRGYRFVLFEDGNRLALNGGAQPFVAARSADYEVAIPIAGKAWRLALYRMPKGVAATRTALPETVLVLGLVLAVLLGIALRSRQLLAVRASHLTRSKQGLEKEVAQRGEELAYLATHDALTGLPNRMLFSEHLRQALVEADRHNRRLTVICLAIDHFQEVNNSLGHAAGDDLLCAFSQRVGQCLRRSDVLARLGGDEFIILCPEIVAPDFTIGITEKILSIMEEGFHAGSNEVVVTTSIGVALYPESGKTVEALIKNADAAMRQAKAAGRNTYVLYGPELGKTAHARVDLRRALRYAVRNGELRVHYQPQVELADGRIVAAEALVRWERPGHGLVPPNSFIPLAEESDLIVQIDSEVLRHVAADLQCWSENGFPLPKISVNVSARQLYRGRLLDDFRQVLDHYPAARGRLEVELTERLLVDAVPQNRRVLDALVDLGVTFAIDDFGTGYSSFGYFRDFLIHTLKIDRSFIQQLAEEAADARITLAIIGLAKTFDIEVVAEGVELPAQQAFLCQHGCARAQGWLFGKPMPTDEFIAHWKQARAV
ncbi:putative bifunctional diguanylate cyclase/phosphodiesterase [Nitrococcus mobilis]|uniref:Predicted signal transduction protein containing a membrane domain, an EAL and a GGDEF domain n=1 Tax=Nitrococcus mobilis Nb-231 TaxID=314278 RepID=A4BL55_9GAMM|nr:EAL domain-containing protein [Nitrococcus mobilis]EAR23043.1 predicted signal transduction protein containing a membrane domain, an EAL and a GGDEF domain [Nitrococcus mobilis Nb-231]